ncbi:MAG: Hsp20/alpha crystallin family protein [Chloroflexota bacterium]
MPPVIRKSESVLSDKRRTVLHAVGWQVQVRSYAWSPPTDVYETDMTYVVRVEVAGMRESDFQVNMDNDYLVITGSRPDIHERRAYHQMEIRFGEFHTAVQLPGPVDAERAEALYEDGFLTVTLPKVRPSKISIEEQ